MNARVRTFHQILSRSCPRKLSSTRRAFVALTIACTLPASSVAWTQHTTPDSPSSFVSPLHHRSGSSATLSAMSTSASPTTSAVTGPTFSLAQFPCLSDNYGFLLHDTETGDTAAIDVPCGRTYQQVLDQRGWKLTHIFNTHHHRDHTGGNMELKDANVGVSIYGPATERIPGIDVKLNGGDSIEFGNGKFKANVIDVGGHTKGHIAYHFPAQSSAFVGDALFSLGCGKMFEGTPEQFWQTLLRLRNLPPSTMVYCAHEYTESNARFALSVEPGNSKLNERVAIIKSKRARGAPTVPCVLSEELETNPFLRVDTSAEIRANIGVQAGDNDATAFGKLRKAKDNF